MDHDVKKLPKWAQRRITHLELELARVLTQLGATQNPNRAYMEEPGVSWREPGKEWYKLPNGATVRFNAPGHGPMDVYLNNGKVQVLGMNGTIFVEHKVSNSFYIYCLPQRALSQLSKVNDGT